MDGVWAELGIAIGLGLLVGLQREWSEHPAGIRTFTLITLLGALGALLAEDQGGWVLGAGLLVVGAAMVTMMYLRGSEPAPADQPELTSVIAALVMYVVGAMVVLDRTAPAIAIAGTTAVLLHWKKPLHGFVGRIG